MVHLFKFEIYFVPAIGITPGSPVVVVTWDSNVVVTRGFGRGEDRE